MKIVECPICGNQQAIGLSKGTMIRLFDTRLLNPKYRQALKGNYRTWTCSKCNNKFIRTNVLCKCSNEGIIIKSEKARPKFICTKCNC